MWREETGFIWNSTVHSVSDSGKVEVNFEVEYSSGEGASVDVSAAISQLLYQYAAEGGSIVIDGVTYPIEGDSVVNVVIIDGVPVGG